MGSSLRPTQTGVFALALFLWGGRSYCESFLKEIVPRNIKLRPVLWLSFWAEVHYNSVYPDAASWD